MTSVAKLALLCAFAVLTGCAASVRSHGDAAPIAVADEGAARIVLSVQGSPVDTQSRYWLMFRDQWRNAMTESAARAGVKFSFDEGEVLPTTSGTGVVVKVKQFRYVSDARRHVLGPLAGNAWVDAEIAYLDLQNGKAAGKRNYRTASNYLQVAFAPMSDEQIRALCDRIVRDVTGIADVAAR